MSSTIDEIGEPAHRSNYFQGTSYPTMTVFYKEVGCKLNLLSTLRYSERVTLQVRGIEKNSFLFVSPGIPRNYPCPGGPRFTNLLPRLHEHLES
jgi:hypothetical protein